MSERLFFPIRTVLIKLACVAALGTASVSGCKATLD
jgi:hypothetical protein